jgi:protein-S-isoprenylcysteine O-methyltransferase Ste14
MEQGNWPLAVGRWLFRNRSHMPIVFATLFLPALGQFQFLRNSHSQQLYWELFCLGISLLGLMVRILTVAYIAEGSSGRELSTPKAEQLNTTGSYSLIRHPLYLGNSIIWLGIASMMHNGWLSLSIMLICLAHHRFIIIAEESYLNNRFGSHYAEWARKTPALIPSLRNWTPPDLPFSMAMVIRREYSGLFQISAVYLFMNAVLNYAGQGVWFVDSVFKYFFIFVSIVCAITWFIVKRTSRLPAPDRSLLK